MKCEFPDRNCSCPTCAEKRAQQPSPYSEGRKDDQAKVRADLYSGVAYLATCRGLTYGVAKYAAWNWAKGIQYSRVYGALLRHLFAWFAGQEKDPESGLSHLDHAGCCLMFLQHYHEHPDQYRRFDDRPHRLGEATFASVEKHAVLFGEALEAAKKEFFMPQSIFVGEKPWEVPR